jgi:hypothetical protein
MLSEPDHKLRLIQATDAVIPTGGPVSNQKSLGKIEPRANITLIETRIPLEVPCAAK